MRKTFCDRCGQECLNYHADLSVNGTHTTSQGVTVSDDDYRPPSQLCRHCTQSLVTWMGSSLGLMSDEEMSQRVLQRHAEKYRWAEPEQDSAAPETVRAHPLWPR